MNFCLLERKKATKKSDEKKITTKTQAQMEAILANMAPGEWYRSSDLMYVLEIKETRTKELLRLMVKMGEFFMKHMLRLTDYSIDELTKIFNIADEITLGNYKDILKDKTVVMFFPASSIRTRVTFEKGINLLGGQTILFPTETLDKKEAIQDVIGYLNNWADLIIVRHKNIALLEEMARYSKVPVINAMTDVNHPCEILSDLYSLSKIRSDYLQAKYLFCGTDGNIGRAWKEASDVFGFSLEQCCKAGYEIPEIKAYENINDAIIGKDIVCTDSLPGGYSAKYKNLQITKEVMNKANEGAVLNPCPPFYRGEEVSANVIDSDYFVGYEFKKSLLNVQQAIMVYCLIS